ncbi:GNAT family N-acetyltransferase [Actinorhabdospora filicis]|nr:GNAT family N-acetyltransferase [Actinorhabdospora filicis]
MRVDFDTDLAAFAADAVHWLRGDPVRNNVAATVIQSRADGLVALEPGARWMRVVDGDRLAGVAAMTPPHPLLVPVLSADVAVALADGLAGALPQLPGVGGPREVAERFTARWSARTGAKAHLVRTSNLYRATELVPPTGVPGHARPIAREDLETVVDWLAAFAVEIRADDGPPASREDRLAALERRLAHDPPLLWVWERTGRIVSVAGRTVPAFGVSRINAVYTPPEHRGHGYAAANVAHLAALLLAEPAVEFAMLYADAAKPANNRLYRRIGFELHGEAVEYRYGY